MKNAIAAALSSPLKSSAKVVDGKLILSFPGALRPVVWQMDFGHVKASALEVIENDTGYALVLKTPKGETVEVAPFETKSDAVKGLVVASKALENAHGNIRPASNDEGNTAVGATTQSSSRKKKGGWIAPALGIFMLFILISIWIGLSAPATTNLSDAASSTSTAGANSGAVGVPLSADDFLNAQ